MKIMKRFLKAILSACWRWTAPVRGPLVRRFDAHLAAAVAPAIRVEPPPRVDESLLREVDLALNSLIREVVRLQMQLEALRPADEQVEGEPGSLKLLAGDAAGPADRARVG